MANHHEFHIQDKTIHPNFAQKDYRISKAGLLSSYSWISQVLSISLLSVFSIATFAVIFNYSGKIEVDISTNGLKMHIDGASK